MSMKEPVHPLSFSRLKKERGVSRGGASRSPLALLVASSLCRLCTVAWRSHDEPATSIDNVFVSDTSLPLPPPMSIAMTISTCHLSDSERPPPPLEKVHLLFFQSIFTGLALLGFFRPLSADEKECCSARNVPYQSLLLPSTFSSLLSRSTSLFPFRRAPRVQTRPSLSSSSPLVSSRWPSPLSPLLPATSSSTRPPWLPLAFSPPTSKN